MSYRSWRFNLPSASASVDPRSATCCLEPEPPICPHDLCTVSLALDPANGARPPSRHHSTSTAWRAPVGNEGLKH
ncbi:hypothetical protein cyc_05689 [Cyclospora cayetanensis]|uniref:Uncharacterized protein n=1 Tax=Cyclospora cayetanensis TaxID=88456 RepID=A0A1D3CZZ7_9EIME|nr:hypothetical protein cyc_05689 [Cyclospora cayetanensis]